MLARTPKKQKEKEDKYMEMLKLQAKMNQEYSQDINDYMEGLKLDIKQLPPQQRDPQQLLEDMIYQKQLFLQNAKSVMKPSEAEKLLTRYQNDDNTIKWFNQFFAEIEKRFKGKKQEILTDQFVFDFIRELKLKLGDIGITDLTLEEIEEIVNRPEDIEPEIAEPPDGSILPNQNILRLAKKQSAWNNTPNPFPTNTVENRRKNAMAQFLLSHTKDSVKKWIASLIPVNNYQALFQNQKANFNRLDNGPMILLIVNRFVANKDYYIKGPVEGFGMQQEEPQQKQKQGYGFNMQSHQRIVKMPHRRITGKGIEPSNSEKYRQFGKLVIHIPSLKKGILNIKYKSFASIPKLPQTYISQDCMEFLFNILNENQMNKKDFSKLDKNEQDLLYKTFFIADLDDVFDIEPKIDHKERDSMKRFELLKAQIIAGNNSPQLLDELESYIKLFIKQGQMNKQEGLNLLEELEKIKITNK